MDIFCSFMASYKIIIALGFFFNLLCCFFKIYDGMMERGRTRPNI